MRILMVLETLGVGGTERQLTYILPELSRLGIVVDVLALFSPPTGATDAPVSTFLRNHDIHCECLGLKERWRLDRGARRLVERVRKRHHAIIHGKLYFGSMHAAMTRPLMPSVRRVVSFHNLAYEYSSRPVKTQARKGLQALLMNTCVDRFAAVSSATADSYKRHLGLRNVEVIPNGIAVDAIRPPDPKERAEARHALGLTPEDRLIVVPARLIEVKGHAYLIEALAQLRDRGLRPKVQFLGWGPRAPHLRALIRNRGLSETVALFDAEVPHEDVLRRLGAADLAVLPSTHEGFPNAAAEALAVGTPLVASRVGGLLDLVEDGRPGLLVPPKNPPALAEAIERVLTDVEFAKALGEAGRHRVETRFSVTAVAQQWVSFYEGLMKV